VVRQRAALEKIPAYKPGKRAASADVVKVSANESPYGPLPTVREAIDAHLAGLNEYPDMHATALREALAERHGVDPMQIAFGAGSVEVLQQIMLAVSEPGSEVIYPWRSFEAYPIVVTVAGASSVAVPLTSDERHDFDAMAAAITERTSMVIVCNPNNPTGTSVGQDELQAFIERVPRDVLVVLDEAYVEFNRDPDAADGEDFFRRFDNVAVLRTFSKAHGLAGLRIGYAIAPPAVADALRKVAVPFAVTTLAQVAALASLGVEHELGERVSTIVGERERMFPQLAALGTPVTKSEGNFFWLRLGDDTQRVGDALAEQGVLVRAFPGEGIRVTVSSPEVNDRVLGALRAVLQ